MNPNFADDIPKTDWSQVNFSSPEIPEGCCDGGRCAKPITGGRLAHEPLDLTNEDAAVIADALANGTAKPKTLGSPVMPREPVQKPASSADVEVSQSIDPSLVPFGVEVLATAADEPPGGHPEFQRILTELWYLHRKKGADYGTDVDCLANIRTSAEFGVEPWRYAILRANEKVSRLKRFARDKTLANETVEDSLLDLASQAILALVLLRE